ncbi:MAG TPA: hydantoinase B/oxoprolinase family protein [Polyangiaceae bacterium]
MRHEIWIDRGGTFTDCIRYDRENGRVQALKVPSSDRSALEGIRALLELGPGDAIPPCDVRLGTTLATNALLERRGVRCALAITRGFADLLAIGDQRRPELFALAIEKTAPLCEAVLEVDARAASDGSPLVRPDAERLTSELAGLRARGFDSLAVAVLNDYARGELEQELEACARRAGFSHVSRASALSPELGFLARVETAVLDAYLTPLLGARLAELAAELPGSRLRLMQSSGVLTSPERFRGPAALLSGPAGGVVACLRIAEQSELGPVVAFDMGGTSTDVARSAGNRLERTSESRISGIRVRTPAVAVTTVAAGGGSLCRFDGSKLSVGPESAGALPGPLCYGHPDARELTVTDVNLLLGRVAPGRFPFPLDATRARTRLAAIATELAVAGHPREPEEVAEGFLEIANRAMADAILEVSVARGHDVREHALLVFGGAGGQHACALARRLRVTSVVFHPLSGVLAAFGLGLADEGWHGAAELGARRLDAEALELAGRRCRELEADGRRALSSAVAAGDTIVVTRSLELRYRGSETTVALEPQPVEALGSAFHARHAALFGYARPEHELELVAARVDVSARRALPSLGGETPVTPRAGRARSTRLFFQGGWLENVPVLDRGELALGAELCGPLIVDEATGTLVIEPGFSIQRRPDGLLVAREREREPGASARGATVHQRPDPVLLEVMGRRFMSIAEQMGHVLRRTAFSTNIRERLDFSCALFDARADLVANAPHIPVHLGAMSDSVRAVVARHPDLAPGDVFVTNDPALGGSHLPDLTVVAPVHDASGVLRFFTASRGHHADVGGVVPGSMPPGSTRIEDEGVVFGALRIVRAGHFDEAAVRLAFGAGRHPARRPDDNVADLKAQIAAVRAGIERLGELIAEVGLEQCERYMQFVQDDAAARVAGFFDRFAGAPRRFEDALDDGTPVVVAISAAGGRLVVDFTGTGAPHPKNLNAPRAVTTAAVLYVLRLLAGAGIPLNAGCLRHVDVRVPEPSLLSPPPRAAVAAGNVETSQRIVDVLLGALGAAAASQGTMNNVCFGEESFGYYETLGGGAGAGPGFDGASGVHTHMTNTSLTDPEVLERRFPVRLLELSLRRDSGGAGAFRGGDGLCREFEFLKPLQLSVISERRSRAPFGLAGGGAGRRGKNLVNGREQPASFECRVGAGDHLRIETPGGGGYGESDRTR